MDLNKKYGLSTLAIHGGNKKEIHGSLATPIYQTSTFVFDSAEQGGARFAGQEEGYIYTRLGNPTTTVLQDKFALLENAEAALAFGSGMGAITSVFWTLCKAGDHIIADKTLYGCTYVFLSHGISRYNVETTFVDTSDIEAVKEAIKPNTKIVYFETPTNPTMRIVDITKLCSATHKINPDIKIICDNTFATPYLTRPLDLGCDIVVHSATKYLNGHGDVIAGLAAGSSEFITELSMVGLKDMTGAVLAPLSAYLLIRGLRTFELRMERHCRSAMEVAIFLESHPAVQKVYYPGLPSMEGYKTAKKQMKNGFGGIMSFELKGGFNAGQNLINNLSLCKIAVSLGDCDTLIEHPASMTHSTYSPDERAEAGILEGLVRLSVGLENVEDIIEDLKEVLDSL
jgi:methionine-gamma-lyase